MTPEEYFFNYAFPCAQSKLDARAISAEDYAMLEQMYLERTAPSREILKKIFGRAVKNLERYADSRNQKTWTLEAVKSFWRNEHNRIIDSNPEKAKSEIKNHCRVLEAVVLERQGDFLVVEVNDQKKVVRNQIFPETKIGDEIIIHHSYMVERLSGN